MIVCFGLAVLSCLVSAQNQPDKIAPTAASTSAESSTAQPGTSAHFTQGLNVSSKLSQSAVPLPASQYRRFSQDPLPESLCGPEAEIDSPAFTSLADLPVRVQQDNDELVEPMDPIQELPDQRVESMPRIGEN